MNKTTSYIIVGLTLTATLWVSCSPPSSYPANRRNIRVDEQTHIRQG